jgi:hypothetical protein
MANIEPIYNSIEKVEESSKEGLEAVEPNISAKQDPIGELIINPQDSEVPREETDTTSLLDLSFEIAKYKKDIFSDDESADQLDLFIEEVSDHEKRKDMDLEEKAKIVEAYCIDFSKKSNAINGNLTLQIVKIGRALVGLKQLVLSERKIRWEEWAKNNIKFLKERNRQTYMRLSKIPGVEKYAVLGKERLLHISGEITAAKEDSDPIGSFFEKHEIPFDPEEETPFSDFKDRVDTAVMVEKAEKKDLELDPDLVLELVRIRFKFSASDMEDMKRIEESNGDPNEYLKSLILNKGKRDTLFEKDKKEESFARYRTRMTQAIDFMIEQENVDKIEPVEIEELINKLQELLKKCLK